MIIKERNHYFDNAKLVLIFLVVFGHFIEPITSNRLIRTVFLFIYTFHMPAFIFISGYFSKSQVAKGWFKKLIEKFIIPYIIFQLLFVLFTKIIGIDGYKFNILFPAYTWWFLFAMFVWNIIFRIIIKLNLKIELIIVLNIIVAVLVGYFDFVSGGLAISRIILFFPFFLLGYYFKIKNINPQNIIKNSKISLIILMVFFIIIYIFCMSINSGWFLCNTPYSVLVNDKFIAPFIRVLTYGCQLIIMFSILTIIPNKRYNITVIGSNTLHIYIIHGFLVKILLATNFYNNINFIKIIILLFFSAIIVYFIGNRFMIKLNSKK